MSPTKAQARTSADLSKVLPMHRAMSVSLRCVCRASSRRFSTYRQTGLQKTGWGNLGNRASTADLPGMHDEVWTALSKSARPARPTRPARSAHPAQTALPAHTPKTTTTTERSKSGEKANPTMERNVAAASCTDFCTAAGRRDNTGLGAGGEHPTRQNVYTHSWFGQYNSSTQRPQSPHKAYSPPQARRARRADSQGSLGGED